MREWINLVGDIERVDEEWLGATHDNSDIFKNPSRLELAKAIKASSWNEARAFLCKNLYVWSSDVLHHNFPMELLAPEDASCALEKGEEGRMCVNLHIGPQGPYIAAANLDLDEDGEVLEDRLEAIKSFVESHPIMRRLFGRFKLSIED